MQGHNPWNVESASKPRDAKWGRTTPKTREQSVRPSGRRVIVFELKAKEVSQIDSIIERYKNDRE